MKQVYIGDVLIRDDNIVHDSTKEEFRRPLGAVKNGTIVELSLSQAEIKIKGAELCVLRDGVIESFPMEARPRSLSPPGPGQSSHSNSLSPLSPGQSSHSNSLNPLSPGQSSLDEEDVLRVSYKAEGAPDGGGKVLWYWFKIRLENDAVCYYGADTPWPSGLGLIYQNPPPGFQLTVYDADFDTPDWAKSAIMYQIFPDRFCMGNREKVLKGIEYHKKKGRDEFEFHEDWRDTPVYEAKDGRPYYIPADIFGGDLEGIRQKLPYIKSLGVDLIYLNPIFESASNHRYNTGDYYRVDPVLGDEDDLKKLVSEAADAGIRLVLDGVFSHTGDDSIYFNKYGRYESAGAYQDRSSPFFGWYTFSDWPDSYESWWGFETLPEVNEQDPEWQDFIIKGEDSVVRKWLRDGAAGYRLDVADELPDETIEQMRSAVKLTDPEALLIGEVWEDPVTKQSYGKQRTYALGRGLDSVMNYPFLNRTVEFLKGKIDAWSYSRFLRHQQHSYPPPMYQTLMNLLSSHDVCRIRSLLSRDFDAGCFSRAEQAAFELSDEEYELGGKRQRLAAAIQFSLPGIPAVYYGDETGMTGLLDPFNRLTFREEDASLVEWYIELAVLRKEFPIMSRGNVRFYSANGFILAILRYAKAGPDYAILTVINPTDEHHSIVLDLGPDLGEETAANMAVNLITSDVLPLETGLIVIDMPPLRADIFKLE